MKLISFLKWFLAVVLLIAAGLWLISHSFDEESRLMQGYDLYAAASLAVEVGDFPTAYTLYLQSAHLLKDPDLKAVAIYEAATVGWAGQIADYQTLVGLYQQSLRFRPGFYEAAFDLEYLYRIRANAPEQLPEPDPGPMPSSEGRVPSGDI